MGTAILDTNGDTFIFEYQNPANLNQLWGQILSEMGQAGIVGEHSSSQGVFTPDPGEGGRDGVGNSSNDNERFQFEFTDPEDYGPNGLAAGAQGGHAVFQAARFGDPNLPPGAIEGTIDPIDPVSNGTVTVTVVEDLG